jgi:RNA recognition motif-containing protein
LCLILQENPSDKDLNQGTLVIFNLDPSVSNEEVRQIFGAYGEVKEVSMQSIVSLHSAFDAPSLFMLTVLCLLLSICR